MRQLYKRGAAAIVDRALSQFTRSAMLLKMVIGPVPP